MAGLLVLPLLAAVVPSVIAQPKVQQRHLVEAWIIAWRVAPRLLPWLRTPSPTTLPLGPQTPPLKLEECVTPLLPARLDPSPRECRWAWRPWIMLPPTLLELATLKRELSTAQHYLPYLPQQSRYRKPPSALLHVVPRALVPRRPLLLALPGPRPLGPRPLWRREGVPRPTPYRRVAELIGYARPKVCLLLLLPWLRSLLWLLTRVFVGCQIPQSLPEPCHALLPCRVRGLNKPGTPGPEPHLPSEPVTTNLRRRVPANPHGTGDRSRRAHLFHLGHCCHS